MNIALTKVRKWLNAHRTAATFALSLIIVASFAQAATTISTNIQTDGDLAVTGNSTLTGTLAVTGTTALGGGSAITKVLFGTCAVDLPSIAASTTAVATCTATGVSSSYQVFVTPANVPNQVVFTGASSTATNVIQVAAYNIGTQGGAGAAVDPASATWAWIAIR